MIDVTFLLLVFFVITTTWDREGKLEHTLPAVGRPGLVPPIQVTVSESPSGAAVVLLDGRTVALERLCVELEGRRAPHLKQDDRTAVYLAAEPSARWQYVLQAYNEVSRAGYSNVLFRGPGWDDGSKADVSDRTGGHGATVAAR